MAYTMVHKDHMPLVSWFGEVDTEPEEIEHKDEWDAMYMAMEDLHAVADAAPTHSPETIPTPSPATIPVALTGWSPRIISCWKPRALGRRADYDINLMNIDGFTRAMSQVKWSIDNASGSTTADIFKGPTNDLLRLAVMDLQSLYAIEPILSFMKETFNDGGLGFLAPKSDLINQEKGTHYNCCKGKHTIYDMRKRTLSTTNYK
ncbi:La-related protein 6 [Hordeum vulgare]|nr:La-related protein 6 [Hordeum vulgare]